MRETEKGVSARAERGEEREGYNGRKKNGTNEDSQKRILKRERKREGMERG